MGFGLRRDIYFASLRDVSLRLGHAREGDDSVAPATYEFGYRNVPFALIGLGVIVAVLVGVLVTAASFIPDGDTAGFLRSHLGEQPGPVLRFVHRGDSALCKPIDDLQWCPLYVLNDDSAHSAGPQYLCQPALWPFGVGSERRMSGMAIRFR